VEDPASVEYITRFVAQTKQSYTQSNGRRPFGISTLIVGFDPDGTPRLFQTDPSGTYSAWSANSIGGPRSKTVREYLEKHYSDEAVATCEGAQKLAIKALLEVVQSGGKNIELAFMERGGRLTTLEADQVEALVKAVEVEKQEETEAAKQAAKQASADA
jgi:20S proteasome subunit alpha 4